jgi:cytochrome d ubiquinol oxidase subunit II
VALCGFLASIYLIGEAEDNNDRNRFVNKAKHMNVAAVSSGVFVFITASFDRIPLIHWIFGNQVGIIAVIAATISLALLWYLILQGRSFIIRPLAAFQVTMIMLAMGYAHYPDFIILKNGENLSLFDHLAPEKTMNALGWALLSGSVFILPALYYLYYSFNKPLTDD